MSAPGAGDLDSPMTSYIGAISTNFDKALCLGSEWFDYGCLFVKVDDGDYSEIYGCESNVPYNHYWVDTIDTEWRDNNV